MTMRGDYKFPFNFTVRTAYPCTIPVNYVLEVAEGTHTDQHRGLWGISLNTSQTA